MSIEAMKPALEALNQVVGAMPFPVAQQARAALRAAIEQAEKQSVCARCGGIVYDPVIPQKLDKQEPVLWRFRTATWWNREPHWRYVSSLDGTEGLLGLEPLYTAPPQREWHGLTNEEREEIAVIAQYEPLRMTVYEYRVAVQIATEAKLKEKNT